MSDDAGTAGGPRLGRVASHYFAAAIVAGVAGYGMTAVLGRVLSVDEFGAFSLFQVVAQITATCAGLAMHGAVSRYRLEETDDFSGFLKILLQMLLVLDGLTIGVFFFVREPVGALLGLHAGFAVAGVVTGVGRVFWMALWKLWVADGKSKHWSGLAIARDLTSLLAVSAGSLWLTSRIVDVGEQCSDVAACPRAWGPIGGLMGSHLIFGVAALCLLAFRARGGRGTRAHLAYALTFSIPLVPHMLSGQVLGFVDRVLVQRFMGSEATGLYSFAYNIGLVVALAVQAANQTIGPRFVRARNREAFDAIEEEAARATAVLAGITAGVALFAEEAAALLGAEDFRAGLAVVPWVAAGYALQYVANLYARYATYHKRTALLSAGTVLAGIANIAGNVLLIPRFGYVAAAWTTTASFALLVVFHAAVARVVLHERTIRVRSWAVAMGFAFAFAFVAVPAIGRLELSTGATLALKVLIGAGIAFVGLRRASRRTP